MENEKNPLRLDIGAGDHKNDGYISVDLYDPSADVRADICSLPWKDAEVDEITCYQVIEHVPFHKEEQMFKELHRVLRVGGSMVTECPDMEYIAQQIALDGDIEDKWIWNIYGQVYRPWDSSRYSDALDHTGSRHNNAFTFNKLQRIADGLGFDLIRQADDRKYSKYPECLSVKWLKLR